MMAKATRIFLVMVVCFVNNCYYFCLGAESTTSSGTSTTNKVATSTDPAKRSTTAKDQPQFWPPCDYIVEPAIEEVVVDEWIEPIPVEYIDQPNANIEYLPDGTVVIVDDGPPPDVYYP